MFVGLPVAHKE